MDTSWVSEIGHPFYTIVPRYDNGAIKELRVTRWDGGEFVEFDGEAMPLFDDVKAAWEWIRQEYPWLSP